MVKILQKLDCLPWIFSHVLPSPLLSCFPYAFNLIHGSTASTILHSCFPPLVLPLLPLLGTESPQRRTRDFQVHLCLYLFYLYLCLAVAPSRDARFSPNSQYRLLVNSQDLQPSYYLNTPIILTPFCFNINYKLKVLA